MKGIRNYNSVSRGRVEIRDFKAMVFLHPDLNRPEILQQILHEFGLSREVQGLEEIRVINDLSAHYWTTVASKLSNDKKKYLLPPDEKLRINQCFRTG